MANNYLQFSKFIPIKSDEESKWVKNYLDNRNPSDEKLGFNWTWDKLEQGIYIYAEEWGDEEQAAIFLQEFIRKFYKDKCVYFTWANFCSRPIADEFYGGAAFITKDSIEYFCSANWANNKAIEFNDSSKKVKN